MSDLISRKEVKAIANKFTFTDKTQERQYKDFLKHCLDNASTIEPVIRCKDCDLLQDCKISQYLGLDGYCSNADVRGKNK